MSQKHGKTGTIQKSSCNFDCCYMDRIQFTFENKQNEDHFLPMHTALNFYCIYEKDDIMNIKFFWNCTVNQKS